MAREISYLQYNDLLNEYFFDGKFANKPIYLDLETEVLASIGEKIGEDSIYIEKNLPRVVANKFNLKSKDAYNWFYRKYYQWKREGRENPPPFTAFLCVLSMSAESMRDGKRYGGNNFYDRYAELLNISDPRSKLNIKSTEAMQDTVILWRALNRWLKFTDYQYGMPTAKEVGLKTYISWPMSQALVRDQDRKNLNLMFEHKQLNSNQFISKSEMSLILDDWLNTSYGAKPLVALWKEKSLQEKVVDAALESFENWDGGSTNAAGQKNLYLKNFSLILRKTNRNFREFLTVGFAIQDASINLVSKLNIEKSKNRSPKIFEQVEDELCLRPEGDGSNISYLFPKSININEMLVNNFNLLSDDKTKIFNFQALPFYIFVKSYDGIYYNQTREVTLGLKHIILCQSQNWTKKIKQFLEENSDNKFKLSNSKQLTGMPVDWDLFEDVEVIRTPDTPSPHLQTLVPNTSEAILRLNGGLELAANIWHADCPPTVEVIFPNNDFKLEIVDDLDKPEILFHDQLSSNFEKELTFIDKLDEKNLIIKLESLSQKLEKSISFRSSDKPKFLKLKKYELTCDLMDPFSFFTGHCKRIHSTEAKNNFGRLNGYSISNEELQIKDNPNDLNEIGIFVDNENQLIEGGIEYVNADLIPIYKNQKVENLVGNNCIITGVHPWKIPFGAKYSTSLKPIRAECIDCGAINFFPAKKVKSKILPNTMNVASLEKTIAKNGTREKENISNNIDTSKSEIKLNLENNLDGKNTEIIFDALCYLGHGSFHTFKKVIKFFTESDLDVWNYYKEFNDLGHIDFELDSINLKPISWEITQPTLIKLPDNSIYFIGFRNLKIINELKEMFSLGDDVKYKTYLTGQKHFAVHKWHNISNIDLDSLSKIRDPNNRKIVVVDDPAFKIARTSMKLSDVFLSLPSINIGEVEDLKKFDPSSGKWNDCEDCFSSGAYKADIYGNKHFYKDLDGEARIGTYEIVKHLSALDHGVIFYRYDEITNKFTSSIGCEVPGLLRRALVASSGDLPKIQNGKLEYKNVSLNLAKMIYTKLQN